MTEFRCHAPYSVSSVCLYGFFFYPSLLNDKIFNKDEIKITGCEFLICLINSGVTINALIHSKITIS